MSLGHLAAERQSELYCGVPLLLKNCGMISYLKEIIAME